MITARLLAQGRCRPEPRATKKPNFFLVGAPKSGTTAMVQYLNSHPDVFMGIKEMHFFGRDLHLRAPFYRHDLREYLSEFQGCNGQRRIGEASVWYLFSAQAASEIRAFSPDARIIIMLREPVEMLYSLYHEFRYLGDEHLPSFKQALRAEPDRRAGHGICRRACFAQGLLYRETAQYADQVKRYLDVFGRERVHVIIYDDLANHTSKVYRDTLQFLGVEPSYRPTEFKIINGNKTVRSAALRTLIKEPLLHSGFAAVRPWLPRKWLLGMRGLGSFLWRLNTQFKKRPSIDPELRAELRGEFAPQIERLSGLLGRDLRHWTK
jgi:hypothetical protein